MATTFTGRLVTPGNFAVPSGLDLAVQRGRMPRFAGATKQWWSVLHHIRVLAWFHGVGDATPKGRPADWSESRRRAAGLLLLHDAEEAMTYDTMTTWKCGEQRALERKLEERIYRAYLGDAPWVEEERWIKDLDRRSLRAEMQVVGPPNVLPHSGLDRGPRPGPQDLEIVKAVASAYADPRDSTSAEGGLVTWYIGVLRFAVGPELWSQYGTI